MKVIIAGSREFTDYKLLCKVMEDFTSNSLLPITEIVCGKQRGADSLGEFWANNNNIKVQDFPANWDAYGLKAGPLRNKQMADYGDYLILFWDGKIRGTVGKGSKDMLSQITKLGKPYSIINI